MTAWIKIVGLGPNDSEQWTQAAYRCLSEAETVYLRTAHHPSVGEITAKTESFDSYYQQTTDPDQVDRQLAEKIVGLAQHQGTVVYAVPGHPQMGEATVPLIRQLAEEQGIEVTIIPGLSFIEPTLMAVGVDGSDTLQLASGVALADRYHPPLNADQPALVSGLHGADMAAHIEQTLLNEYRPDFMVTLVQAAGSDHEKVWRCSLAELAQQPHLDEWTTLYLPADRSRCSLVTFQETMAHLLSPEGCPWDRAQTHQSLRPYLLEETYEALEALDGNDLTEFAEELGDVLLQIALHAQIANLAGTFSMADIISHINRKMIRRHPHVFSTVEVDGVEQVFSNWETIKAAEKQAKGQTDTNPSALDGVPQALPALAQAMALSKKAVRAGFEWDDIGGVLDKIWEEIQEVAEAETIADIEAEIGDVLFSVVNLARWRSIDPESALRATNARFSQRFKQMETLAVARQQKLSELSLTDKLALWQAAKQILRDIG